MNVIVVRTEKETHTEWGVSFTNYNPEEKDYVKCYSEADAFRLKAIIENEKIITEDNIAPVVQDDKAPLYHFVRVEGFGGYHKAMYRQVNGECGWWVNFFAKIQNPILGWIELSDR